MKRKTKHEAKKEIREKKNRAEGQKTEETRVRI